MNQNAQKTANSKVEKDFYKLLNKSNFGNDCRNNIGNCSLTLLYDGPEELKYIKKFRNIFFDEKFREFFMEDVLRKQVEDEFDEKLQSLDPNDEFYIAEKESITELKNEKLEAIEGLIQKIKKNKKKNGLKIFLTVSKMKLKTPLI